MKIIAFALIIGLVACKQTNNGPQSSTVKKQAHPMAVTDQINIQDITSDNIVEAIHAKVQRYKEEPMYYLRIGKANCLIEILVNDFPAYKSYELSNLASPLRINSKILKSGTQTVTVRMYPVGDLIKEEYEHGETITQLGDASAVSITVTQIDKQSEMDFDDEHEVMKHHSPTTDTEGEVFAGSGLPFYEYSFEFEAEVPYDLSENSWGNAADLKVVKQQYLEEEALTYYRTFLQEFKKGNKDYIAKMYFESIFRQAQTYYNSKDETKEMWDEELELLNNPTIEPQPIKDYELVLYAGGGVCQLRHKNPSDKRLRNKSSAWFLYKRDGRKKAMFYGLYLYCPKKEFKKRNLKLKMA
ncbi:hypothetical protein ATE84_1442 [Aquimarina sp. MAR_2010_214]|uniref:hypothetical protein n=1 Tax=Aquimarina sp. MAR_2010_214 TaxID=1250026 RepID=UPI000C714097|nr:hypothetical protein [Aquimarina sp. MAR_2010_214]PKV49418.1 hypothetical protein ATE84_1442 [Aquimarina sp. MAR_2010_214]